MALYELRDMRGHALYHGAVRPAYVATSQQWVTPDCVVNAPISNLYCIVELPDPAAPDPARILTHIQYMNRFTDAELEGLYGAAQTVVAMQVWLKKFELADDIDLDDPLTIKGLNDMEAAGMIGPGRAAEILK